MGNDITIDEGLKFDVSVDLDDTTSIDSLSTTYSTPAPPSILSYRYENGRRYHGFRGSSYFLPNDEHEQDRLEVVHEMFKLIVNGDLHRAPLPPNLCRALDFGTGTGNWAIEFADEHPDCEVLGTDLSSIQPPCVPPNCLFVIEDVRSPWIFDQKFDYIHGRSVKGIVTDWDVLYCQIHNNLENGGWVEIQEIDSAFKADDDTLDRAPKTSLWNEKYNEAGRTYVS
jgi:hypothetical protein